MLGGLPGPLRLPVPTRGERPLCTPGTTALGPCCTSGLPACRAHPWGAAGAGGQFPVGRETAWRCGSKGHPAWRLPPAPSRSARVQVPVPACDAVLFLMPPRCPGPCQPPTSRAPGACQPSWAFEACPRGLGPNSHTKKEFPFLKVRDHFTLPNFLKSLLKRRSLEMHGFLFRTKINVSL